MRVLACLLTLSLLLSGADCRAAADLELELRADAQVGGQVYPLREIALIRGGSEGERARLGDMQVGSTPRMGYTEHLAQSALAQLLARREPSLAARIRWSGAAVVQVQGRQQKLAGREVDEAAQRALTACLAGRYDPLTVEPVTATPDLSRPQGTLLLALEPCKGATASRRMRVNVAVQVDGRLYTRLAVWFSVQASTPAWVAKRPLEAGDPLQADAFRQVPVEVTGLPGPPLDPGRSLAGLRLRVPLQADATLLASAVEARPPVLRDHPVQVRVSAGAILLETVGIALADARLGDVVRVRNASTQEAFSARVVDNDVVALTGE